MTGSSKAYDGKAVATFLILLMGISAFPLSNAAAEDLGDPYHLQAQDIVASFDNVSELTTITWRNTNSLVPADALDNFFSATYNIYRHTEQITQQNIGDAVLIHQKLACDSSTYQFKYQCLGGDNGTPPHPGHSYSYQVSAGTNDHFYYGITTQIVSGQTVTEFDSLIQNESSIYDSVYEITNPIRTPYNLQATFDITTSQTHLTWVNYNDIFPVLPEEGENAYVIRLWQTDVQLNRQNAAATLASETPIVELPAGTSSYSVDVPPSTDREIYYSITYSLPNFLAPGVPYEDLRFLTNNAISEPVPEDNMPPSPTSGVSAIFNPDPLTGSGITTITWTDLLDEEGETYSIYSAGALFNNTTSFGIEQIGSIPEGVSQYQYQVPIGRLGTSVYCVVVVDGNGIYDTYIPPSACTTVYENAFYNWIAEPTNVRADFLGNGQTLVTWQDQLGAEGEFYHIWRSVGFLLTGSQFQENVSATYLGTVTDGIQEFLVEIEPEIDRASYYYVTSEALYQHSTGPYHFTSLVQNSFGPVFEDTLTPSLPDLNEIDVEGELNQINIVWDNDNQLDGEEYTIWRHFGQPFGETEDIPSTVSVENGWEIFDDGIVDTGSTFTELTFSRNYDLPQDVDRFAWYAITVSDIFGNTNIEANPAKNALKIKEDTKPPEATYKLLDENNQLYTSPALVSGAYTIRILVDEYLEGSPTVELSTSSGGQITNGPTQMLMFADNFMNEDLGPEYYYTFDIAQSVTAGIITITSYLTDESQNEQTITWTNRSLDAQYPTLNIYSPSASSDGSKYLYGNSIKINAGAIDDVQIAQLQYRFTYNYGSGAASTTPWTTPQNLQDVLGDNKSLVIDDQEAAGNFDPGQHAISFKAVDSAGNEVIRQVVFIVDYCRNTLNGTTVCNYEESLKPEPEPIIVEPSYSDPPYVFVWVTSGVAFFSVILMLIIIQTSMRAPKKKKSDDEYDDDDWMAEFIGTTQEVDMDSITQTKPVVEEQKDIPDIEEEDEDDPFAVNVVQRKTRRSKPKKAAAEEEDDDDDAAFFGLDDDDFEEDEPEEKPKPRRKVGRRSAPKNAPKRRVAKRKKTED